MRELSSLTPFVKYSGIIMALIMIVALVMPYATFDFAVVFLFGLLLLSPIIFIGHFIVVYKIGRKMQQGGAYSGHLSRLMVSVLCGILFGLIFPMAFVIQDILEWGHFNYRLIVNSFVGDFESNWPTQVATIMTIVSLFMGMEKEHKVLKSNLGSAENLAVNLEEVK